MRGSTSGGKYGGDAIADSTVSATANPVSPSGRPLRPNRSSPSRRPPSSPSNLPTSETKSFTTLPIPTPTPSPRPTRPNLSLRVGRSISCPSPLKRAVRSLTMRSRLYMRTRQAGTSGLKRRRSLSLSIRPIQRCETNPREEEGGGRDRPVQQGQRGSHPFLLFRRRSVNAVDC